jgi:anti-sigma regulatory factor (Ser/Thr protein kinase)
MIGRAEEIRTFILNNISEHPKDIVAVTAEAFSISRTTVHRHLDRLVQDKKITKTGITNRAVYFLFNTKNKKIEISITPGADEHKVWSENFRSDFENLEDNVSYICNYGFTEIFNNAIDHSEGSRVSVETEWGKDAVKISVIDNGIGIFKKIKTAFNLQDERESILQLSKGKLTTEPQNHTGEGIFFTSRAFDEFAILANDLFYCRLNDDEDWFIETRVDKHKKGTAVSMEIRFNSKRKIEEIFDKYASHDTRKFDKTHICVKLSELEEEKYISRSQAKRLLVGLEKFREVILDFKNVSTVGQAFVDEVFRVFKNNHPEIQITYTDANDNVKFMIERGLPT